MDARSKLAARYANGTQLGGKGTQSRTRKVVTSSHVEEDKKLKTVIKKFGVQPLTDIDEVNMFKNDNTVVHFSKPLIQFSVKESLLLVTGACETKELKNLLPDIIK